MRRALVLRTGVVRPVAMGMTVLVTVHVAMPVAMGMAVLEIAVTMNVLVHVIVLVGVLVHVGVLVLVGVLVFVLVLGCASRGGLVLVRVVVRKTLTIGHTVPLLRPGSST